MWLLAGGQNPSDFSNGSRLITEEVSSVEHIVDMGNLELLAIRLPDLVGSPLSINALREDLQVSHKTVSNWLNVFERLFLIFRLHPFGAPKIRAVKKEQKHYHFDWTLVQERGLRFPQVTAMQVVPECEREYQTPDGIQVLSAITFLKKWI